MRNHRPRSRRRSDPAPGAASNSAPTANAYASFTGDDGAHPGDGGGELAEHP